MWRRKGHEAATKASSGRAGGAASSPRAGTFGSGRVEWRAAFAQRVLPSLRAFCPDLAGQPSEGEKGAERPSSTALGAQ